MNESLARFIDHARQKDMDHATVFLLLRPFGWKEREIAEVFASRELGVPVPERAGIGSPRDAFFHLLAFTALYAWVISLSSLLFAYIDFAFPDSATRTSTYALEAALTGIRVSLATLVVSYPLFLLVWSFLLRQVRLFPERAMSGVRRWLSFMSLFAGAVTILANVVTVVYFLVEGDLTVRFILKVGVLLLITGSLSAYLALTLRYEGKASQ
jgi:hypothetical protein